MPRASLPLLFVLTSLLSLSQASADAVDDIKLLPGFKAELVYTVPEGQGSWVAMTADPQGRLITSDQYGKLYRVTPAPLGSSDPAKVETIDIEIGTAQGMLYAFDSLYVVGNGDYTGLFRLQDTTGDDQYDKIEKLVAMGGGGEHGPHGVVLSPDGKSLYVIGGNSSRTRKHDRSRVPQNWANDLLLPKVGDAKGFMATSGAPAGWLCRISPDGTDVELISMGMRNAYDIAFNPAGDVFTFDADMEWDMGTPWYRPTRVCHLRSGAEFGWRSGSGKWPDFYADSLPAAVDIGPGSPTGVVFGTGAKFPAKYQRALYVCDWSFGKIYAVHMQPNGASYGGTFETFATAAPLPATDIVVHPIDKALYFAVGGRKTSSALYRVIYEGDESTAAAAPVENPHAELHATRRKLEALHQSGDESVIDEIWPYLGHEDRDIRFAARIALEHQPAWRWQDRALNESNPAARVTAVIAVARQAGAKEQPRVFKSLAQIEWSRLTVDGRRALIRAYQLAFTRMGASDDATRQQVATRLDELSPVGDDPSDQMLAQLLVYLDTPSVVPKTLELLANSRTQHQQLHYASVLRLAKQGWTDDYRQQFFEWINLSLANRGGASFDGFTRSIRDEAVALMSDADKEKFAELLKAPPVHNSFPEVGPPREVIKSWTLDEFASTLKENLKGRDYENGRKMFVVGTCYKCHRFRGEGGIIGPDLTGVGGRFTPRDLLQSVIEPNKEISDQYKNTMFLMEDGKTVVGRIVNLGGNNLSVMQNMLDPNQLTSVDVNTIEEKQDSPNSPMPTGLLNTLTAEEIYDLVAYLRSGGDPEHPVFKAN